MFVSEPLATQANNRPYIGGISFYAAELGWGIDRVRSFEVALADGRLVKASSTSEPDLYRALRGGGSNLGIITTFDLESLEYSGMWGGRTTIAAEHAKDALSAYVDFNSKLKNNPKSHTIVIFDSWEGQLIVRQYIVSTQPKTDLPIFDRLRQVPALDGQLGLTNYSDLAADIAQLQSGGGWRHAVSTMTIRLDESLMSYILDLYTKAAQSVSHFAAGCLEFHALPISPDMSKNMYGLEREEKPLISVMLGFSSPYRRYDYALIDLQRELLQNARVWAEERDLYHPFLFANYGGPFQDMIGSYGQDNVRFLAEVAQRYDPDNVFQKLQPGSFKLGMGRLCPPEKRSEDIQASL